MLSGVVVVVVTDLRPISVDWFALSCFLELWNPGLARLWPGLDVFGPTQYVDLPVLKTDGEDLSKLIPTN